MWSRISSRNFQSNAPQARSARVPSHWCVLALSWQPSRKPSFPVKLSVAIEDDVTVRVGFRKGFPQLLDVGREKGNFQDEVGLGFSS
jgi:hypothetical protein